LADNTHCQNTGCGKTAQLAAANPSSG
jgi:hypothetical protein